MQYRTLGHTPMKVSALCLGTMTFGEQNTQEQAHQQLDLAFDSGINFIDTAEMYPVPPKAQTYGKTEEYIGTWPKLKTCRDKIILASKVVGLGEMSYIRQGQAKLDKKNIHKALEDSLKRLKTDYIDLYQLHWPDRHTNYFGRLFYEHRPQEDNTPLLETLQALDELVIGGKVRAVGLSNETAWGAMKYLELAKNHNLVRVSSIQNPYSLLNRSFEVGLSEVALREGLPLLAYSPLGFGVLTGKYLNDQKPAKARLTLFQRFSRYTNPMAQAAVKAYVELACELAISPAQLALQFVTTRNFVASNIIGATTLEQLKENMASIHLPWSPQIEERIEEIHKKFLIPCP